MICLKRRIHIFGASGSGTSTIARDVCCEIGYRHFDTDNYLWLPTDDPFTELRPVEERLSLMWRDLGSSDEWMLSGSFVNWGDPLIPLFDLIVFVYVPTDVRVERLKIREYERYGDDVLPGGHRYDQTVEFIEWAAEYDTGPNIGRSLAKHEKWLEGITCSVLKITNISLQESVSAVLDAIMA